MNTNTFELAMEILAEAQQVEFWAKKFNEDPEAGEYCKKQVKESAATMLAAWAKLASDVNPGDRRPLAKIVAVAKDMANAVTMASLSLKLEQVD